MKRKNIISESITLSHLKLGLIAALAILSFLALVFFINDSQMPTKVATITLSPTATIPISPTISPTPIPTIQSCGENECVIKELGIKFTMPNELKDLVYITAQHYAAFSTRSLMIKSNGCKPSEFPLGHLSKINKSEIVESSGNWRGRESELKRLSKPWRISNTDQTNPPATKEFDEFYILYDGPQSVCAFENEISKVQSAQIQLFKQIISTIELIK